MNKLVFILTLLSFTRINSQDLSDIDSWAYQLQNINIDEISNSNEIDLMVIDYSHDGSEEGKLTRSEIDQIKADGKIVVSYISIGEAESYRFYWNNSWDADNDGIPDASAPSWLGNENPDWEGNYKVRFWQSEWQNIIYGYIDEIIEQGFDGIYCDIIDAYYYWAEETSEEPGADSLMMSFIFSLREYINEHTDDIFYIIPQNGEYIIEEANIPDEYRLRYLNTINAIGIEDVFFYGDADENNPFNPDNDRIRVLQDYRTEGIPVFSVEYLTQQSLIDQFVNTANSYGFIPYATVRALDVLAGIPTEVKSEDVNPQDFFLLQNYPNPFNPTTIITYSIPVVGVENFSTPTANISLIIYDILGQEVATLVNGRQDAGLHKIKFSAEGLSSGIYYYKLTSCYYSETRKMLFIK